MFEPPETACGSRLQTNDGGGTNDKSQRVSTSDPAAPAPIQSLHMTMTLSPEIPEEGAEGRRWVDDAHAADRALMTAMAYGEPTAMSALLTDPAFDDDDDDDDEDEDEEDIEEGEGGIYGGDRYADAEEEEEKEAEAAAQPSASPRRPIVFEPCPVLYARACGTQDAWLVLVDHAQRPYVVVREDSPAADFVVRYTLLRRRPPYLDSSSSSMDPSSDPTVSPERWAQARTAILRYRHVPFVMLPLGSAQPEALNQGSGDGPPAPFAVYDDDDETGDGGDEGNGDDVTDTAYYIDALIESMGAERPWLEPVYDADAEAVAAGTMGSEPTHHPPHDLDPDLDADRVYFPRFTHGMGLWAPHVVTKAEEEDEALTRAVEARLEALDDGGPMSPYESPLTLLGGDGNSAADDGDDEDRGRRRRPREGPDFFRAVHSWLASVGLVNAPATERSRSRAAEFGESTSNPASPPPEPADSAVSTPATPHNLEEGRPTLDSGEDATVAHPPSAPTAASTPVDPSPSGEASKPEREHDALPTRLTSRTASTIERRLLEGRWCRMTLREFMCWRCVSETPLREAWLAKAWQTCVIPPWMATQVTEAKGSGHAAPPVATAADVDRRHSLTERFGEELRGRAPLALALADAQERLHAAVAQAIDAATPSGPNDAAQGLVLLRADIWHPVVEEYHAVAKMHAAMLQPQPTKPIPQADV